MKKLIVGICLLMGSIAAFAGTINDNGKKYVTKITTEDKGDHVRFKGAFPKISFRMSKQSIVRAMLKHGETRTIGEFERNGVWHSDRKLPLRLRRVADGLYIDGNNVSMFVTEKELERVKKR